MCASHNFIKHFRSTRKNKSKCLEDFLFANFVLRKTLETITLLNVSNLSVVKFVVKFDLTMLTLLLLKSDMRGFAGRKPSR